MRLLISEMETADASVVDAAAADASVANASITDESVADASVVDTSMIGVMKRAAEIAIRGEGLNPDRIEISLSFVSPEEIHELNREHRGVDRVTDVLSFPMVEDLNELMWLKEDEPDADDLNTEEMETADPSDLDAMNEAPADADSDDWETAWTEPLGDVVICLEKAEAQAKEYGHSRDREIVYLFVHSVLHLLGYDHMEEDEKRQMRAREEEIMQILELPR